MELLKKEAPQAKEEEQSSDEPSQAFESRSIFVFSEELPDGCELRVRSTPTTDGEVLGLMTSEDKIVGYPTQAVKAEDGGRWLRVDFDGHTGAWMLQCTASGMQLLEESMELIEDLANPNRRLFGEVSESHTNERDITRTESTVKFVSEEIPPEPTPKLVEKMGGEKGNDENGHDAKKEEINIYTSAKIVYTKGQKVECRYMGMDNYYPATIAQVENGRYDILYDDGGFEEGVDGGLIRHIGKPTTTAPHGNQCPLVDVFFFRYILSSRFLCIYIYIYHLFFLPHILHSKACRQEVLVLGCLIPQLNRTA
jgi:hypothetical protein